MDWLAKHAKAFSAPIGALLGWATVVVDSGPAAITSHEWLGLAVGLVTAFGVTYAVPNRAPNA